MKNAIEGLQEWFISACNGDWEHTYGITIETLDNPGWSVAIDLTGTTLQSREFQEVKLERTENDWLFSRVVDGVYRADCGPANLEEAIGGFLSWAANNKN